MAFSKYIKSNTPQQADGAYLSLFLASCPKGWGICTHRALTLAAFVKYPCKHGYFPKCPVGTLLAGIKQLGTDLKEVDSLVLANK